MNWRFIKQIIKSQFNTLEPAYLIVFVESNCNLHCTNCCDASRSINEFEQRIAPSALKWSLSGLNNLAHITFTGGEPFLHPDLITLCESAINETKVPSISINSNGILTNKIISLAEYLPNKYPTVHLLISISIDGDESTHDKLRGVSGCYKQAMQTVALLHEITKKYRNLKIRISSLLNEKNIDFLTKDKLNSFADTNADLFEIIFPRDIDSLNSEKEKQLLKQYVLIHKNTPQTLYGKLTSYMVDKMSDSILFKKTRQCEAGRRMLEILPNGDIIGCEMKKMRELGRLGNINEEQIESVISSDKARKFRALAQNCTCTFECSIMCSLLFNIKEWRHLIYAKHSQNKHSNSGI